jgi:DHA1 family bicyclomycin/chloramphenicol resistance-like MFS transporter
MFSSANTPPRLFTLILLTALSLLSLNMFLPSLSNMARQLHVDYALVNLSIAGYAGCTAILQLVMGPLSDRFGRRPVLLAGVALFVLASLGCALAVDIGTFLAFRFLQGAIICGYVVSLAVIRDSAPPQEAAARIGYVSMAMAVAPMLGPMFGGLLDQAFGWRASFWAYVGLGAALFALCWVDLGETNKARSATVMAQFRTYPALVASRRFWAYALCMAFSTGAFYAFLGGAPLVASAVLRISPASLGIYMGSTTAGFVAGSFLSGRYASRHALITMMIAGRLVACCGLAAGLTLILAGVVHVASLFGPCLLMGMGNGLTMPSASAGAISVRPDLAGSASGLAGALTVGGGAVISSITGAIVTSENGATALLGVMLATSLLALVAALTVLSMDRRDAALSRRPAAP